MPLSEKQNTAADISGQGGNAIEFYTPGSSLEPQRLGACSAYTAIRIKYHVTGHGRRLNQGRGSSGKGFLGTMRRANQFAGAFGNSNRPPSIPA